MHARVEGISIFMSENQHFGLKIQLLSYSVRVNSKCVDSQACLKM